MSKNHKIPFWLELFALSARSGFLWFARCFITSWYVYFVIHMDIKGGGYFAIVVALLSVFGLIQLIEIVAKFVGLKDRARQPEPQN